MRFTCSKVESPPPAKGDINDIIGFNEPGEFKRNSYFVPWSLQDGLVSPSILHRQVYSSMAVNEKGWMDT